MPIYYFTNYDFYKKSDLLRESIKKINRESLEKAVNILKSKLPKGEPHKKKKIIKLIPLR